MIVLLVMSMVLEGCSKASLDSSKSTPMKVEKSVIPVTNESEIEAAKQVLIRYLQAMNDNDFEENFNLLSSNQVSFHPTVSDLKASSYKYKYLKPVNVAYNNQETIHFAKLYSGCAVSGQPPPEPDKIPYKVVVFNVELEYLVDDPKAKVEKTGEGYCYVLIQERENEPWKIHGRGY